MQVQSAGISDIGLKREGNEDSYSIEDSLGLYVVADGMGGHVAGEVASRIAVEMINKSFKKWITEKASEDELFGTPDSSLSLLGNYVLSSIRLANKVVYEMALEHKEYHGMGTTVVLILITPELMIAANVGDSRLYMLRDGELERLSKDHTIVAEQVELGMMTKEEAENSPMKHILTRNFGSSEDVVPDIFEIEPMDNDRFILCSDGLTDLVKDDEIMNITQEGNSPESICRKLLDTVLRRGAHDNTTIISLFLSGIGRSKNESSGKIGQFFADSIINLQKMVKIFR